MFKFPLFLLVFFVCFSAIGQQPTGTFSQPNNSRGIRYNGFMANREFYLPIKDTLNWTPLRVGEVTVRPQDTAAHNGIIYTWAGTKWFPIGTGGGGGSADGNNFPSSLAFSNNTLTLGRTGLSSLTATIPLKDTADVIRALIAAKLNISDTASMLSGYVRVPRFLDSIAAHHARLNLKLNIADTINMRPRLHPGTNVTITGTYPNLTISSAGSEGIDTDTTSLSNRINANDALALHKAGDETATGVKTFNAGLYSGANILATTDATYDIGGLTTNRFRNLRLSHSIFSGDVGQWVVGNRGRMGFTSGGKFQIQNDASPADVMIILGATTGSYGGIKNITGGLGITDGTSAGNLGKLAAANTTISGTLIATSTSASTILTPFQFIGHNANNRIVSFGDNSDAEKFYVTPGFAEFKVPLLSSYDLMIGSGGSIRPYQNLNLLTQYNMTGNSATYSIKNATTALTDILIRNDSIFLPQIGDGTTNQMLAVDANHQVIAMDIPTGGGGGGGDFDPSYPWKFTGVDTFTQRVTFQNAIAFRNGGITSVLNQSVSQAQAWTLPNVSGSVVIANDTLSNHSLMNFVNGRARGDTNLTWNPYTFELRSWYGDIDFASAQFVHLNVVEDATLQGTLSVLPLVGTGTRIPTISSSGILGALANGSNGQVLKIVSGAPTWSTDETGGGGGATFPATHVPFAGDDGVLTSDPIMTFSASGNLVLTNKLHVGLVRTRIPTGGYSTAEFALGAVTSNTIPVEINGATVLVPTTSYTGFGGGGSSQWTTTGSDIYFLNKVRIGQSSATTGAPLLDLPNTASTATANFGSFTVQGVGATNGFLAGNAFWDGTNIVYRATGAMAMFQFLNGDVKVYTGPSGTGGDPVTYTNRFQIGNTGTVNISGIAGTGLRIMTASSTGDVSALANGTNGYVLKMVSGSPAWAAETGGGGGGAWGAITGTLSDQTDLQTALDARAPKFYTINDQGGSYTLILSDASKLIRISSSSTSNLTVPPNSSVAFQNGTIITVERTGTGAVILTAGSGVTINSEGGDLNIAGRYSAISLVKTGVNEWSAYGDLNTP